MYQELTYFWIKDHKKVAKIEDYKAYIFKNGKWVLDEDHVVNDRIIGYEPGEGIGCTDMLNRIEQISAEEAERLMRG